MAKNQSREDEQIARFIDALPAKVVVCEVDTVIAEPPTKSKREAARTKSSPENTAQQQEQ